MIKNLNVLQGLHCLLQMTLQDFSSLLLLQDVCYYIFFLSAIST